MPKGRMGHACLVREDDEYGGIAATKTGLSHQLPQKMHDSEHEEDCRLGVGSWAHGLVRAPPVFNTAGLGNAGLCMPTAFTCVY